MSRVEHLSDDVTLYLGDAIELVPALSKFDAVVTDPPYGIKHSGDSSRFSGGQTRRGRGSVHGQILNDDKAFDPRPFLLGDEQIFFGANCFLQHLQPGSLLIWAKRRPSSYGSFLSDGEVAWFSRGRGIYMMEHIFAGSAAAIEYTDDAYAPSAHPFQKPMEVMKWCVSFTKGQTILDPFMGSGTTGVACVQLERKFIGIELEPRYFEIACRRISDELRRPRLQLEPVAKPVQEAMSL